MPRFLKLLFYLKTMQALSLARSRLKCIILFLQRTMLKPRIFIAYLDLFIATDLADKNFLLLELHWSNINSKFLMFGVKLNFYITMGPGLLCSASFCASWLFPHLAYVPLKTLHRKQCSKNVSQTSKCLSFAALYIFYVLNAYLR